LSIHYRSLYALEWFVGPNLNTTWSDAHKWVEELAACGGRWAMPQVDQLKTLFHPYQTSGIGYYTRGEHWLAHLDPIFSNIGEGSWVWAAGNVDTPGAPAFNFNQGVAVIISPNNKEYTIRAFAVRHAF
jgi:hypothetical protein